MTDDARQLTADDIRGMTSEQFEELRRKTLESSMQQLVVKLDESKDEAVSVVYDFCGALMLGEKDSPSEVVKSLKEMGCTFPEPIIFGAKDTADDMLEARTCPDCNGRGEIELFTSWAECDECGGTGRV